MLFSCLIRELIGSPFIIFSGLPHPSSCRFEYVCLSCISPALSSLISEFQLDPSFNSSVAAPWHSFLHVFRSNDTKSSLEVLSRSAVITKKEHLFGCEFLRGLVFSNELSLLSGGVLLTRETLASAWASVKVDSIASNRLLSAAVTQMLNKDILGCAAMGFVCPVNTDSFLQLIFSAMVGKTTLDSRFSFFLLLWSILESDLKVLVML